MFLKLKNSTSSEMILVNTDNILKIEAGGVGHTLITCMGQAQNGHPIQISVSETVEDLVPRVKAG